MKKPDPTLPDTSPRTQDEVNILRTLENVTLTIAESGNAEGNREGARKLLPEIRAMIGGARPHLSK